MLSPMQSTSTPRIALIPVGARKADKPAIRRYRLGRVVENLGPALAGQAVAAPSKGERAP